VAEIAELSSAISQQAREIGHDATVLAAEVGDLRGYLADRVEHSPLQTLGAAAGVGYLLGGGLNSKLTESLLAAAATLSTAMAVLRELADIGENLQSPQRPSATPRRSREG